MAIGTSSRSIVGNVCEGADRPQVSGLYWESDPDELSDASFGAGFVDVGGGAFNCTLRLSMIAWWAGAPGVA